MANEKGVWRTIGGRRVFIKEGQDLASAMKESGKFKSASKGTAKKEDNVEKKDIVKETEKEALRKANENAQNISDEKKLEFQKLKQKYIESGKEEDYQAFLKYEKDNNMTDYTISKDYNKDSVESLQERMKSQKTTNGKNPIEDMANDRIKEKENTLNNDKILLDGMKKRGMNEINGTTQADLENRIKKNEDYLKVASNKELASNSGQERISKDTKVMHYGDDFVVTKNGANIGEFKSQSQAEAFAKSINEKFEVSELKNKAQGILPSGDIDTHEGDLYIKKTKTSEALINNMKNADSGLLSTFRDQETGETWYDIPFANMGDDYKEKTTNDIMNEKIRSRGKTKIEDDLPKHTEIKTQGTSNRKEVSDNIQAHILDYYTSDFTGEDISPAEAFVRQMDAMGESNMWNAGKRIAEGGSYLIYNQDMADFLDELKINPKGKTFSEDKAFNMYTSLIGRESAKLYDRIQKNSYKKYMKAHPLSKMSFEEFKDMNKK